jgi:hypothetical protein
MMVFHWSTIMIGQGGDGFSLVNYKMIGPCGEFFFSLVNYKMIGPCGDFFFFIGQL